MAKPNDSQIMNPNSDLDNKFDFFRYPILLVDDEPAALDLFRFNFAEEFQILTANNAAEALEIVGKTDDLAVILADQRMPGMTGTDFFAEIQKTHPQVIRILVTGYVDFNSLILAINSGRVYHYIEKPWDDADLRLTIRRGIEHFHLIRERDRLQAERIQTLEKMARSNRLAAVGTLAAGIAHEIRNPLSAIITFHQMLPEKLHQLKENPDSMSDDFWTTFAKIPLREVERIKKLVDELLNFSRGQEGYQMEAVNLVELINGFLPILETDIRRGGIELHKNFSEQLPEIEGDADKIKQVFLNLILNAIQATPMQGKINIVLRPWKGSQDSCEVLGGELVLEDTGEGISPEDLERVFDPFFTTRPPGVGTGLGLTMCHHIITNHGGEIHIHSRKNEGTQVLIRLPKYPLATKIATRKSAKAEDGVGVLKGSPFTLPSSV